MDIEKLPSNSHKSYNSLQEANDAKKQDKVREPLQKVTTGKVTLKKPSLGKRFANLFLAEDVGNVREYIVHDVLIPTIKNGIFDMFQNGLEMLFYGRVRGRSNKSGGTFVSYNSYSSYSGGSKRDDRPASRSERSIYSYNDVEFQARDEAQNVLDMMGDQLERYGRVSVADFYDLAGITRDGMTHYNEDYYGWTDLGRAYIARSRGGYIINLPRCEELR